MSEIYLNTWMIHFLQRRQGLSMGIYRKVLENWVKCDGKLIFATQCLPGVADFEEIYGNPWPDIPLRLFINFLKKSIVMLFTFMWMLNIAVLNKARNSSSIQMYGVLNKKIFFMCVAFCKMLFWQTNETNSTHMRWHLTVLFSCQHCDQNAFSIFL